MTKSKWCGVAASLVAVTLAGCGGGSEPSGMYKAADAVRLANVAPRTPGWPPWPAKPEPKKPPSGESPEEIAARDPIYAEYRRRTADIEQEDDWGSFNKWVDEDKLGNLVVGAFDTAADAHASFLASNELSRAYGAKYGFVVRAEKVDGLGDEAWRLWTHSNGREVTYHWRRDNLFTEVHVDCYGDCGPDLDANVDAAARAWADAIDEEATRLMTKNASRYGEGERVVARVRAAGRYLLRVANHAGAESPGSYAVAVTMQRSH